MDQGEGFLPIPVSGTTQKGSRQSGATRMEEQVPNVQPHRPPSSEEPDLPTGSRVVAGADAAATPPSFRSDVRVHRPSLGGSPSTPASGSSGLSQRRLSTETLNTRAPEQNQLQKKLLEVYEIEKYLGEGAFSKVWRCVHKKTKEPRAVKVIDMSPDSGVNRKDVRIEIAMMRLLRHENVVRCYDVFMEPESVNIVVDIFTGGDLMDGMSAHYERRGPIPECQVRHLARQMAAALAHIHGLNITHRDIKGENFLLDRKDIGDLDCQVALADFGTAVLMRAGQMTTTEQVGTRSFWPPEIWRAERYGQAVDIWAMGVTTFVLLAGRLPFDADETQQAEVCRPVAAGELLFTPYDSAHGPCVDFLAACMTGEAAKRPTAAALAASSPWLLNTSRAPPVDATPAEQGLQAAGGCLRLVGLLAVACCHCLAEAWDVLMVQVLGHNGQDSDRPADGEQQALAEPLLEDEGGKGEGRDASASAEPLLEDAGGKGEGRDASSTFAKASLERTASFALWSGARGADDNVWVVVYDGNGVRVRKDKSLSAEVLTAKISGDIVRGEQEGDWLALTSEPGFMMLGNADGDVLLVKKSPDRRPEVAKAPPAEGWLVLDEAEGVAALTESS